MLVSSCLTFKGTESAQNLSFDSTEHVDGPSAAGIIRTCDARHVNCSTSNLNFVFDRIKGEL